MTRLQIDVSGAPFLDRELARMTRNLRDPREAFEVMADQWAESFTDQFDSEGHHASGGWKALSPAYAARKQVLWPGARILEASRRLRNSLARRPFAIENITAAGMVIGTDVPYALYHQRGTGRMPARRIVDLTEPERRDKIKALQRLLMTGTARPGARDAGVRSGGRTRSE